MPESIGLRIKNARKRAGLSQRDLAVKLQSGQTLIGRWERDEVEPRGSTRMKIAAALGVDSEWLRTGQSPMAQDAPTSVSLPGLNLNIGATMNRHPVESDRDKAGKHLEAARQAANRTVQILDTVIKSGSTADRDKAEVLSLMDLTIRELLLCHGWEFPEGDFGRLLFEAYKRIQKLGGSDIPLAMTREIATTIAREQLQTDHPPSDELIKSLIKLAR